MAVTHADRYQLSLDSVFQNRVQAALLAACVSIANEGWGVPFHRERASYATQILSNTNTSINYAQIFANTVATDANVIGDATQSGTVTLTTGNRATQAALVTDAHIDTAIAAEFNAFIRVPSN
jgi:hypothetical protein